MSERRQRNWVPAIAVLALTTFLGPPIGGVLFFVGLLLIALVNGDGFSVGDVLGGVFGAAALSYLPGGVQAIVMGLISAVVVLWRGFYSRFAAAGFAIASNALVLLLFADEKLTDSFRDKLLMFLLFTVLSVVAALVLQAMFRKFRLIKPLTVAA